MWARAGRLEYEDVPFKGKFSLSLPLSTKNGADPLDWSSGLLITFQPVCPPNTSAFF